MNVRDQLVLDFGSLIDGETITGEHCPACQGGSTGERTLVVSNRSGTLLWYCYRASCQFKGAAKQDGKQVLTATQQVSARGAIGRSITRQNIALDISTQQGLESKYAIDARLAAKHSLGWDESSGRLCLPVCGYQGEQLGVSLRSLTSGIPKSLTHTEKGVMAWYPNHTAAGVIVVEDQLSAIRASDYLTSVALLGTNLNDERAEEIKATGLSPVYIALDADAWNLTVRYCIKYRGLLKPLPIKLTKDIKNMSREELDECILRL